MTASDSTPPHRRPLLHWVLGLVAALLVATAAALAWLTWNDWNRSRGWVSEKVSQAIGRDFAIGTSSTIIAMVAMNSSYQLLGTMPAAKMPISAKVCQSSQDQAPVMT